MKWNDFSSSDNILSIAKVDDIEIRLIRNQLRWLGHVSRMDPSRPVKALLYGMLAEGCKQVGRPLLRYKETLKRTLKNAPVVDECPVLVLDWVSWRSFIGKFV